MIAVLLTLVGVAIITVPWWIRLVRDLGDERQGRIRERERAEIAAHLHDSVLQTLALIQRQAGDSREVVRLARGQERELRTWLYGPAGYAAAGGGNAARPQPLSPLRWHRPPARWRTPTRSRSRRWSSATAPMDPHLAALVAAAREAMINAAKHSGAPEISVYAEIEDGTASVFVRDRGAGFDVGQIPTDRRGMVESIRGRMERHGGKAVVRSSTGRARKWSCRCRSPRPATASAAPERQRPNPA